MEDDCPASLQITLIPPDPTMFLFFSIDLRLFLAILMSSRLLLAAKTEVVEQRYGGRLYIDRE